MYRYNAEVLRVVDGDTLDLRVDLGFGVSFKIRARLYGVDTPEKFGVKKGSAEWEKGVAATEFAKAWISKEPNPNWVMIESHNGSKIKKGKYGRWLVEVFKNDPAFEPAFTESLNDLLLETGHAKEAKY